MKRPNEIWKKIQGFGEFYEVSNYGFVKSYHKGTVRILKPSNHKLGYLLFSLYFNKKIHYRYGHRLVAQEFLTPIEGKTKVNHKDCNKKNNFVGNLEYCTMAENNEHAGVMNLKPIGSSHTNSKLTNSQLAEVRYLLSQKDLSHKKISKLYAVHRTTISRISRNQTYKKEIT